MKKYDQDMQDIEKTLRQTKKVVKEARILSTIAVLLAIGTIVLQILVLMK